MTGHKSYVEDRDGTCKYGNSTWKGCVGCSKDYIIQSCEVDSGTTMGSYDISGTNANAITWKDCVQSNFWKDEKAGTVYSEQKDFWGIMGTNYCKNLTYDGCTLSRFDAHCGVYNATVKNSTISYTINSVGMGTFTIENTTMVAGSRFLYLRNDYGSTWKGTVIIKNSTIKTSSSTYYLVAGNWVDWDFGYKCYMPDVVVDGVTFGKSNATVYAIYYSASGGSNINNIFSSTKNAMVMPTQNVVVKNAPSGINFKSSNITAVSNAIKIEKQ